MQKREEVVRHPYETTPNTSREPSRERNLKGKEREDKQEKNTEENEESRQKEREKEKEARQRSKERKHIETCGCNTCFLEEAKKIEKIDERKITKLINIKNTKRHK